jgi:hypothetical protein
MSMCDDPPQRKKSTQDFAGFATVADGTEVAVVAFSPGANLSELMAMVEAVRNVRRFIEGRKRGVSMRGLKIALPDYYAVCFASLSQVSYINSGMWNEPEASGCCCSFVRPVADRDQAIYSAGTQEPLVTARS